MSDEDVTAPSPEGYPERKKYSKKSCPKKSVVASRKGMKKNDDCSVVPEEIPDVPPNLFLLRQSRSPECSNRRSLNIRRSDTCRKCKRSVKSRSGRKLKGRGVMRYRTPSPDGDRSGSETPPHWKAEQSRVCSIKDVKKSKAFNEKSWKIPWVEDSRTTEPEFAKSKQTFDCEKKAHEVKEHRKRENSGISATKDLKNVVRRLWNKSVKDLKKATNDKPRTMEPPPLPKIQVIKPKTEKSESSLLLMNYFNKGNWSESEEDTDHLATEGAVTVDKNTMDKKSDKTNNNLPTELCLKKTGDETSGVCKKGENVLQTQKVLKAKGNNESRCNLVPSLLMNYFKQGLSETDSEEENSSNSPCDKVTSEVNSKDNRLPQCLNVKVDSCTSEGSLQLCEEVSPIVNIIKNNKSTSELLINYCHQSSSEIADDKNLSCIVANKCRQKQSFASEKECEKTGSATKKNQNVVSFGQSVSAIKPTKSKKKKSVAELILSNYYQHSSSDDDTSDTKCSNFSNDNSVPQKNNLKTDCDTSATANKQKKSCSESSSEASVGILHETNRMGREKVICSSPDIWEISRSQFHEKEKSHHGEHLKNQGFRSSSHVSRDKFKKYRSEIYKEEKTSKCSETGRCQDKNSIRHMNNEPSHSGKKSRCSTVSIQNTALPKSEFKYSRSSNMSKPSRSCRLYERNLSSRSRSRSVSSPERRISQVKRSVFYEASSIVIRRARSRSPNQRKETSHSEHDQKLDSPPRKQSQSRKRKTPSVCSENLKRNMLSSVYQNKTQSEKTDSASKRARNRKWSTSFECPSPNKYQTNLKFANCDGCYNRRRRSKQDTKRYSRPRSQSRCHHRSNRKCLRSCSSSSSGSTCDTCSSGSSSSSSSSESENYDCNIKKSIKNRGRRTRSRSSSSSE